MALLRNVAVADVQGPYRGGNAWDLINPRKANAATGDYVGPDTAAANAAMAGGNPVMVLIMGFGALIVFGWIINSSAALSGKLGVLLTPAFWLMNIFGVILGIVTLKLLMGRFPLPGVAPIVALA